MGLADVLQAPKGSRHDHGPRVLRERSEKYLNPSGICKGKHVRYDAGTVNQLLHLQYTPHGPDELELVESTNMEEISNEIYGGVTKWNIVRGEHAHFPSKDLHQNMKVWHHFIYGQLVSMLHTLKVMKERGLLLYRIKKGLKINVGGWINTNIWHAIRQGSGGIPHSTLLTELIVCHEINTTS